MLGGTIAPTLAVALPRIASMNVCTDQLLIPLADPEQILGLSRYSRDRFESWAADDAQRFRILSGGAEDILVLRPDVVVASLFDKRSTRELLKQKGLRLAEFAVPRNLEEAKAQIRQMGEIAGHPDRADAEIARLDAAIARARRVVVEKHYSVLRLGLGARQSDQLAPGRDRAKQRGRRSRRRRGRLRLAGSGRQCKARFSSGGGRRRSRRR
jgi:iron complex transport system substrate-binding protein